MPDTALLHGLHCEQYIHTPFAANGCKGWQAVSREVVCLAALGEVACQPAYGCSETELSVQGCIHLHPVHLKTDGLVKAT